MRNFTKFLAIVVLGLAFSATISAQVTENGTATATILSPIQITQTTQLNFGSINPGPGGTVEITTAGARNVSGVATVGAGFAAGVFTVTGTTGLLFSIDIPATTTDVKIYTSDGANFMNVRGWTSSPTEAVGGALAGAGLGTATITVGAILQVGAGQAAGTYSSANPNGETYPVTVNYN